MIRNRSGLRGWGAWAALVLAGPAFAADPVKDAADLAKRIDRQLTKAQAAAKVQPAPLADDGEYLRRLSLDLAGRIPSLTEARQFLDSKDPDKRRKAIEALLKGPHYANHFTVVWRNLLLPEANTNIQTRIAAPTFEEWLRRRLSENTPYDNLVRELLTTPIANGAVRGLPGTPGQGVEPTPAAFYTAKEFLPENLASDAARLFLGVNVGCAQCHDHPFASWKREQFWGFAAFFGGLRSQRRGDFTALEGEARDNHTIAIPNTNKVAKAKFLDGTLPDWSDKHSAREKLAEWLTTAKNPYFARAAVNRLWAHFFGVGLQEPLDEMAGADKEPTHPDLLDLLAKDFAAHDFDLKYLIRAFVSTEAYQRTSARTHVSQNDPHQFAKMPLRGLTAEQLFDSLAEAVGAPWTEAPRADGRLIALRGGGSARDEFLTKFANTDRPTEMQTSILQALVLMNGGYVSEATSLTRSQRLAAVLDMPSWTTEKRLEALYLAALSRRPKEKEIAKSLKFIEEATTPEDGKTLSAAEKDKRYRDALADVFWVLLNSSEFYLSH
jgi:hypothetical protein